MTEKVTVPHVSAISGKDSQGILDMVNVKLLEVKALLDNLAASPATRDQEAYELYIAMWGFFIDISGH